MQLIFETGLGKYDLIELVRSIAIWCLLEDACGGIVDEEGEIGTAIGGGY